jgi:hypothetical protein
MTGSAIQVASQMSMGYLGTIMVSGYGIKSGIVATMVIFNFGYSLGWTPSAHTVSTGI